MNFARVLKEVLWCLVTEGTISYRRIKLTFGLDDDGIEELRSELIGIKRTRGRCRRQASRLGVRGTPGPTRGYGAAATIALLAAR